MGFTYETEQLEFKKSTAELKEGIISLSAMLNKHGHGEVYFGVKNDGIIQGQQIGDSTLRDISQAVADFIKPQIIPEITIEFVDNKNIIKLTADGKEKPYSAYGKYYIRSADEDREASPSQLRQMMATTTIESIASIESNDQNLLFTQLKSLYLEQGFTLNEEAFLNITHLLTQNGKYNLMANILADSNSFSIKVARFQGKDKTKLIKRNEYGYKCLLIAMRQVLDYVEALNETTVDISGAQRTEEKLFDFECFREAWLNACLHNKWIKLTPPSVYFFDDRIEIVSIGGLPSDYSVEDFFKGRSRPVNLELQQIMGQLHFIEQTGHGVPLIVSRYGREAFDLSENFITVTIPFAHNFADNGEQKNSKLSNLNPSQIKILEQIEKDSTVTMAQLSVLTGLSKTAIYNAIKKLTDKDIIVREGAKKNGNWKIL